METIEVINKKFRDEAEIWFDYIDYIKSNYDLQRRGLKYKKRFGRFEIYLISEDGEEILIDVLENNQGEKLTNIINTLFYGY